MCNSTSFRDIQWKNTNNNESVKNNALIDEIFKNFACTPLPK